MYTKEEIIDLIEKEDIEFIRLQFTDPFGELRNVAVTAHSIEHVMEYGYEFDMNKVFSDFAGDDDDEYYLVPDLSTFAILPWRPQSSKVARFICDICDEDGNEVEISPRSILKKTVEYAKAQGYSFSINPECEFFLYHTDDNGIPTTLTHEEAGYMDVSPLDLGENARRDMVIMLENMGFGIKSSHHEAARAQHEIDFEEDEPLEIADSFVTFKAALRSIAKGFGLHATFMPKPKMGQPGSGMHINIAAYKDDYNIFKELYRNVKKSSDADANFYIKQLKASDKTDLGINFVSGINQHAAAMSMFTNPTVNSYKRERTLDIKLHKRRGEDIKAEVCFPDAAANIYLVLSVLIRAGITGDIRKNENGNIFMINNMPENLEEAVKLGIQDDCILESMPEEFVNQYGGAKSQEWFEFMEQVTEWELQKYLYRI